MANVKAMTLRLEQSQAAELETVARVEGLSISEVAREAIMEHIERRRNDKKFQAQLHQIMEQDREIFERFAAE